MKLAAKLAWEYRWSWVSMFILTAASALVLIVCSHVSWASDILTAETGNATLKIDFYISVIAVLLIVQTIAALCLESQAKDLAIIKTCGASPRSIRRTLRSEILLVTATGFAAGALLAWPVIVPYTTWAIGISAGVFGRDFGYDMFAFVGAGVALLLAVWLGSLTTIRRVSRQNVVGALHGETVTKAKRRFLAPFIASLAIIMNIALLAVAFNSAPIVDFVTHMAEQSGGDALATKQMVGTAQGSLILMPSMIFVLGLMIIFGAFAPKLYRGLLRLSVKLLPKNMPGWLEVGVKQATFNAAKYYGSITPLVVFVLVIVMMFAAIDGSLAPIKMLYAQHGVTIVDDQSGTNYESVVLIIGPALLIAFVGSIANMMMSGRGRIYVNKLTSIIGLPKRRRVAQALAETISYVYVAGILGLFALLVTSFMVWITGNSLTNYTHPFVVAWPSYLLALATIFIVMAIPAIVSVQRSRKLSSREVLESFGE